MVALKNSSIHIFREAKYAQKRVVYVSVSTPELKDKLEGLSTSSKNNTSYLRPLWEGIQQTLSRCYLTNAFHNVTQRP